MKNWVPVIEESRARRIGRALVRGTGQLAILFVFGFMIVLMAWTFWMGWKLAVLLLPW